MNALGFWREVRHVLAQLALYRELRAEHYVQPSWWAWARRFVIWGLPFLLVLIPGAPGIFLLVVYLLVRLQTQPPWRLNSFEALRMSSRRALFSARLLEGLLHQLWQGLAWSAHTALWWPEIALDRPDAAVLLSVALAPVLVTAIYGLVAILTGTPGWAILVLFALPQALLVPFRFLSVETGPSAALLPGLPVLTALLAVGLLAAQVWAINRLEPLRQVRIVEPQVAPAAERNTTPTGTAIVGPAPLLRRRHGIFWAALYRVAAGLRHDWRRPFQSSSNKVWYILFIAFLLIFLVYPETALEGPFWSWVPWLGLFVGSALRLHHPEQVYLLGVNFRAQLLHRLRTFWTSHFLILLAVFLVAIGLIGGAWGRPLSLLASAFALGVVRAGWWEWPSLEAGPGLGKAFGLTLGLGLFAVVLHGTVAGERLVPDENAQTWLFAAVAGVLGLAGCLWKLVRLDEATLVSALRSEGRTAGGDRRGRRAAA
jgi:hypothetical protein